MTTITKTTPANALPSEADMAEWREAVDEATPGPYVGFSDKGRTVALMPAGRGGDVCTFPDSAVNANADANFFRVARVAVPALLDATARLLGDVERLEAEKERGHRYRDKMLGRIKELEKDNARLTETLAEERAWDDEHVRQLNTAEAERARLAERVKVLEADRNLWREKARDLQADLDAAADVSGSNAEAMRIIRDAAALLKDDTTLNPERDTTDARATRQRTGSGGNG